jgi:hypothetical protein
MSIRTKRVGQKARCFESAGKKYKMQDLIPKFEASYRQMDSFSG